MFRGAVLGVGGDLLRSSPEEQALIHMNSALAPELPTSYGPSMWITPICFPGPKNHPTIKPKTWLWGTFCPEPGQSDLTCFLLASRSTQGQVLSPGGMILTRFRARKALSRPPAKHICMCFPGSPPLMAKNNSRSGMPEEAQPYASRVASKMRFWPEDCLKSHPRG